MIGPTDQDSNIYIHRQLDNTKPFPFDDESFDKVGEWLVVKGGGGRRAMTFRSACRSRMTFGLSANVPGVLAPTNEVESIEPPSKGRPCDQASNDRSDVPHPRTHPPAHRKRR